MPVQRTNRSPDRSGYPLGLAFSHKDKSAEREKLPHKKATQKKVASKFNICNVLFFAVFFGGFKNVFHDFGVLLGKINMTARHDNFGGLKSF